MNTLVASNSNGDFLAEGLLPGKYRVFLMQEANSGIRIDTTEFQVIDHDLTGITIKVSKGAGITGLISVENDNRHLRSKFSELTISAYVQPPQGIPGGMGNTASSSVSPDGGFTLGGLPEGNATLNVYTRFGTDHRWSIIRIERDGVVQRGAIELKEGEQVAGVRVVVTYGTATLRGLVALANGEPFKGGSINIRLTKPGENSPLTRPTQVDARGRFVVEGVPAGTYELLVIFSGQGIKPRTQRQQVALQDNTATDVTVTLDMTPDPKP